MKFRKSKIFFITLLLIQGFVTANFSSLGFADQAGEQSGQESSKLLKSIIEEYWNHKSKGNLYQTMLEGKNTVELPDISLQKAQKEAAFSETILEKLKDVDPEELGHKEWIDFEVLKWQMGNEVKAPKYFWLSFLLPPVSNSLTSINSTFTGFKFEEKKDKEDYLNLLKLYPDFVRNVLHLTQEQFYKGIILPKEIFPMMESFLQQILDLKEKSALYVQDDRLKNFDPSEIKAFQQDVLNIINSDIQSALMELVDFVKGDYKKQAPENVGLWQYPGGKDYYRYLAKINVTLDLSPEQIHLIGLHEIKSIEAEVNNIKNVLGFEGTLDEFKHYLKTDPRFFPKSPQEIEERLLGYVKLMDSNLDDYFLQKPRAPYGVKRLQPELEGSMTFGYYQPPSQADPKGYYRFNGSKPEERSLLMAEALIYHELVPGHHFHFASQLENNKLPAFRHYLFPNAFNEGWAEYAGWLGVEMGLYEDPYSKIGKYMLDMMLTVRLVVDTGMNYFGWPRSMAVQFMRNHMIESEVQIYAESLRYSVRTPAQALGYKIGSIEFAKLRKKTERELGDKFDIKRFHQNLLENGALPLFILKQHVDWYIQEEKSRSRHPQ